MQEARYDTKGHIVHDSIYTERRYRQIHQKESRLVTARDCGEKGELRAAVNGSRGSFWGNGNALELDNGDGCTIL